MEEPILDAYRNAPAERISSVALDRLVTVMGLMRQEDGFRATIPIQTHIIEQRPQDIESLIVLGRTYTSLGMPDEAIRVYQQVADIPDLPVGLAGLLQRGFRITAKRSQAENALQKTELLSAGTERSQAIQSFIEFRESLAAMLTGGENAAPVLMLDAKLAILEREYQRALRKLTAYQRETAASEIEVLRLQTRCFLGINQLGAALDSVEDLLLREPENTQALLLATEIDRRLREPRRAVNRLRGAVLSDPDNVELQKALNDMQARLGITRFQLASVSR